MAFEIPKLQYKNVDLLGNTAISSGVITGITPTTNIEVGMFVRGTGIPAGALVGSKTANTVTLASGVLATANGINVPLSFGYEIIFDYPPIEPTGENYETVSNISESISGVRQRSVNRVEALRKMKFSFLSPTLFTQVNTFLTTHALYGKTFRYFENKNLTSYTSYELESLKIAPRKIASRGATQFVWEVPLTFYRVL